MEGKYDYFEKTNKPHWYSFEGFYWLEPSNNKNHLKIIDAYIFNINSNNYIIDNYQIEIQVF